MNQQEATAIGSKKPLSLQVLIQRYSCPESFTFGLSKESLEKGQKTSNHEKEKVRPHEKGMPDEKEPRENDRLQTSRAQHF